MKRFTCFLLIASLMTLTACKSNATDDYIEVNTIASGVNNIETTIDIAGVFTPYNSEKINSKISGIVNTVNAEVGQYVNAGDTLVVLDTKELEAQLMAAQAALGVAKDQANVAKTNLDAAKSSEAAAQNSLAATKSVIEDQVAQAKINLDAAQKAYDSVQEENNLKLEDSKLNLTNAQNTYDRVKTLFDAGSATKVEFENAEKALDAEKNKISLTQTSCDSALTAAKSKLDAAKTSYQQAVGSSANNQIVSAQSNLTSAKSKVDTAKSQYNASASSAIEQAQANVNSIMTQLSNAVIKAHISGVVVNKNINEGELAQPGSALLVVADTNKLKLNSTVSQEAIPFIKEKQEVDVFADILPDKALKGTVDSLGPISVNTGSYFPIEISIDNADKSLMAGISAHASINVTKENVIAVPTASVIENEGQTYLFVVENGLAVKRNVVLGLKSKDSVEILNGLANGEEVAVSNVNALFDQMHVNTNSALKTN